MSEGIDQFGFSWGLPISARKPLFMGVGIPWISLDSLVRIETYQWVARDFPRKFFLEPCLGARGRNGLLRSRPFGRARLFMGQAYFNFGFSAINCRPTPSSTRIMLTLAVSIVTSASGRATMLRVSSTSCCSRSGRKAVAPQPVPPFTHVITVV